MTLNEIHALKCVHVGDICSLLSFFMLNLLPAYNLE